MQKHTLIPALSAYLLLPLALFIVLGTGGWMASLSIDAFISPFTGQNRMVALVLVLIAIFDLVFIHHSLIPLAIRDPANREYAMIFPQVLMLFGFLIAVLESNLWMFLPFHFLAAANSIYVWWRTGS